MSTASLRATVPGKHHVWNNVKKPLVLALSGALVATTAIGAGAYTAAHKTITLDIDGNASQVSTFSGSVKGLLEENDIVLADGDLVAPSENSVLREGGEVVVRYQREVTVDRDGDIQTIKTTAVDADELLAGLESRGNDVALVASRSRGQERVDIGLRLNTDGPVALLVDGKNYVLEEGHGEVADIIREHGIVLGDDDRISIQTLPVGTTSLPVGDDDSEDAKASKKSKKAKQEVKKADKAAHTEKASAEESTNDKSVPRGQRLQLKAGMSDGEALARAQDGDSQDIVTLVIQRVDTKTVTKKSAIDFKSKTIKDPNRFEDLGKIIKTAGVKGKSVATYEEIWVDGVRESRKKTSDEVVTDPITEVIVIGTKERPKPVVPAPSVKTSTSSSTTTGSSTKSSGSSTKSSGSSTKSSGSSNKTSGGAPEGVWAQLAQCESGGNPSVVSSNGLYHGLYQFTVSTWKSVGGSGLPSQASPAEQTKRAKILQQRSGWGQWPACSRKLGLL